MRELGAAWREGGTDVFGTNCHLFLWPLTLLTDGVCRPERSTQ